MINYADEAVKFWDMMNEEEKAAEWRQTTLRALAERDAAKRYPFLKRKDPAKFAIKVDTMLEFRSQDDRIRNTHIGNSQWYRDKAKTCALLAILHQHEPSSPAIARALAGMGEKL